jgi:pyrroline-5-carboxylate reductase
MTSKVAFIGGGQMAQSLARGAVRANVLAEQDLIFAEPDQRQQQSLRSSFSRSLVVDHAQSAIADAAYVVLAVKPQVLKAIADSLASMVDDSHLVVSIAAGISLSQLQSMLKSDRIIRVMPNTPAQVGAGAAAIAASDGVDAADVNWVENLMNAVGMTVRVPDHLLHAVTGVSGSGPAYIYLVIEALSDGGVAAGLPRDVATRLAAQTVLGAAKMVLETGQHPGQLKDQVTSPGGTTIAAIRKLEAAGVRSAFIEAVVGCAARSEELA